MNNIFQQIEGMRNEVIDLQRNLTKFPAINPENGGDGEYKKYLYLKNYLMKLKFDSLEDIFIPDNRVSDKVRPCLIASYNGVKTDVNLWIITHMDVVPPGDLQAWRSDPYTIVVEDDKIYGRGTEDNQQSLVSSIIAVKALMALNIKPAINIRLLFVSDEEVGSEYGMQWLLANKNLFNQNDLIITPDVGEPDGSTIEIAEKSVLWVLFKLTGKQSHGSRPDLGINTATASSHLCVRLEKLRSIFNAQDKLFDVPYSTFEPTKRANPITNMNTIPGDEFLGMDCRVMPQYDLNEVKSEINKIIRSVENDYKVKIDIEYPQVLQAPAPTPVEAKIVIMLKKSIKKVLNIEAVPVGIGGGTVAAYFRMKGYPVALWSTNDNTMHSPNEYSSIKNTLNDAKVFADLMMDSPD